MWKFKGRDVTNLKQLPEGSIGFIYIMTLSDGKKYIGRKNLYSKRKRKFGKKELANITDKRLKTYEMIIKESDWAGYNSSNKFVSQGIKEGQLQVVSKEIIKICYTLKQMTYFETQALFCYGVLEYPEQFYNDNIMGKFYKKDLYMEETEEE